MPHINFCKICWSEAIYPLVKKNVFYNSIQGEIGKITVAWDTKPLMCLFREKIIHFISPPMDMQSACHQRALVTL